MGKVLHRIPTVNSTNQYAFELLAKSKPIEGTAILTYRQTAGRGQIGSKWESEPDKNIAISLIFYPRFLEARQQFRFNQAVALGVADALARYSEIPVRVKWPNDIYIGPGKVSGILIQNSLSKNRIQSSVAGIGINVNQTTFSPDLPNPVSLKSLSGTDFALDDIVETLCACLEARYLQLRQGKTDLLQDDYRARLYRFGERTGFQRPDGTSFTGQIIGVDDEGKLLVEKETGTTDAFDLKTIIYR